MKVILFGASGMIGSRVLKELLQRGHTVTAVARNPENVAADGAKVVKADITDQASVAAIAKGADAVISAYAPPKEDAYSLKPATSALLAGIAAAGVKRVLIVGGAGSLEVAPGVQAIDAPGFHEAYRAIALAHRDVLGLLKESSGFDWSYFSPAGMIQPGERTGKFRIGGTKLITNDKGESRISAEDYAIALLDELENPKHLHQQFTIGY